MRSAGATPPGEGRLTRELMHAAATLYYLGDATQAEIATRLGVSRPTVSRLLSEARRTGMVRIEVAPLEPAPEPDLAGQAARHLGLQRVYLAAVRPGTTLGASLAPALAEALRDVSLASGAVLLVSSGRTIYEAAAESASVEWPQLPGVLVAPTVGGQDEPEAWYQTNELTRQVAARVGGEPVFLYAPALPGASLHRSLVRDPAITRVLSLWDRADAAILGVGPPLRQRDWLPSFVPTDAATLAEAAGDICSRFFDASGKELAFPGSERLLATPADALRRIPATIAVAAGRTKLPSLFAGARAGWFNHLVTDAPTAQALLRLDGSS